MSRIALVGVLVAAAVGITIPFTANAADSSQPVFTSSGVVKFSFVPVGSSATKTLTVSNANANAPLNISLVDISGPDTADFTIVSNSCINAGLKPGLACKIEVRFAPTVVGTRVAALRFTDGTPCKSYVTIAGSSEATSKPTTARAATCDAGTLQTVTQTTSTNTTTTVTQQASTPTINGQSVISAPSSKVCVSKRKITFHLAKPAKSVFTKVVVKVGKKTIKTLKGNKLTGTVSLAGLPRGRFTLTITAKLKSGRTITQKRHYVTCVAKK